jgi:hypothetical protein
MRSNINSAGIPVCFYSREATNQAAKLAWIFDFMLIATVPFSDTA